MEQKPNNPQGGINNNLMSSSFPGIHWAGGGTPSGARQFCSRHIPEEKTADSRYYLEQGEYFPSIFLLTSNHTDFDFWDVFNFQQLLPEEKNTWIYINVNVFF